MAPQGASRLTFHAPEPPLPCVSALRSLPPDNSHANRGHGTSFGDGRGVDGSGDDGDGAGLEMETRTVKWKENGCVDVGAVI